ncbi:PASTA domain-containing protein [Pedobacter puniceum]|jgi:beta-lactam-binding protein with PASTA domain|uniref:PASTA domain-containing protein n=1 Tax=Pedobacter puniceum TaxID=2666136 RepID=A0A7K0FKA7_9SPHI|nr:PASTA domain-containing protein [Pedobacter puniceum]MRX46358.1 PASTA domain-containing protein [Pedobacter puniceum]
MNKFFKYLATPEFRKQLIIAFAAIVILLFSVFLSLRYYTRHGEGLPVPNLKGLDIESAIKLLEADGFRYQIDSVFVMDKKPGLVLEQDPDPETNVKTNRIIYLTIVSSQTPDVSFPDIDHKTLVEVQAILANYGLKLGDTTYKADIARDAVLAYSYAGQPLRVGQKIPKGSKIDLVLGDGMGASEIEVPDLRGLTLSEARFSLKGSSLTLGDVLFEGNVSDTSNAIVISQTPSVQDSVVKVSIGTRINLVLSNQ